MRIRLGSSFVIFLIVILFLAGAQTRPGSQPEQASGPEAEAALLADLLAKTAAYCEKVKGLAFHYVCEERIESRSYIYRTRRVGYIPLAASDGTKASVPRLKYDLKSTRTHRTRYVYQLIGGGEKLSERRTLVEEDGRKRNEEVAQPKDVRFQGQYLVFGPVGFLSKSWQDNFTYKLAGREKVDGREAVIILCEPRVAGGQNDSTGRVWVDPGDGTILQIEWEPQSIQGYREEAPPGYGRGITWTTGYGVEKNGVRFPSRQIVHEFLVDDRGLKVPVDDAVFVYEKYRFFTVGVEIKYDP
ncbi:MAG: hypothetical protein OEW05_13510 [Candidatus Aminicenantes bacterium]|nr:hypothetical protein [Candidatus Aminicenantes bacterium]